MANPLFQVDTIREILSYLPVPDLLQCRLVNRLWLAEVNSYMHDHRQVNLIIPRKKSCSCSDVRELNEVFMQVTSVPFNGFVIDFKRVALHNCDKGVVYGHLLQKMRLLYLYIRGYFPPRSCPASRLSIRFLRKNLANLKTLELQHYPQMYATYFGQDWVPQLPLLKQFNIKVIGENKEFVVKVLRGAQNLKILSGVAKCGTIRLLPPDKHALIKYVMLGNVHEDPAWWAQFSEVGVKLHGIRVHPSGDQELFFNTLRKLLESSKKSLVTLELREVLFDLNNLVADMPNLRKFTITANDIPDVLDSLRSIKYGSVPALKQVSIDYSRDMNVRVYDSPFALTHPMEVCHKLNVLDIACGWPDVDLEGLCGVFPNVSHLLFRKRPPPRLYERLWALWACVESVEVHGTVQMLEDNLDAKFLGIHVEEAEDLRGMSEKSLQGLNIVTMPSMLTMKNLKSFVITISGYENYGGPTARNCFLSELAGTVAFKARGIQLSVNHSSDMSARLKHMGAFARLTALEWPF